MEVNRAIELMKIEATCVRRQDGTECPRNCHPEYGCYGCDLLQDNPDEILEAYDTVIECMKVFDDLCLIIGKAIADLGFDNVDDFKQWLDERMCNQNADNNN